MAKKIMVNPHSRILRNNKKEQTGAICSVVNESEEHYDEQKKLDIKIYTPCDCIYMKF